MIASALLMTMLPGCGRNQDTEAPVTPFVTAEPASPVEPAAAPESETAHGQPGEDLNEGSVTIDVIPASEKDEPNENDISGSESAAQDAAQTAPTAEAAAAQISGQNQKSASQQFTGVMGAEFIVPEGFIQVDESPNIGYQYTFWHPDYEIRIVVNEIAPGYIPEGAYETDCDTASKNPDVTYFNKGENWFVQSGYNYNGEEIFYSKESSVDGGLKTFRITYPTAKREFGDSVTAEFEKNFSF